MSVFRRYLLYRLKSSTIRTILLTLISIMFTISIADDCSSVYYEEYKTTGIYILAIILGVFCTLIPMLEMSGFKNRRNLDTLYFFPINRGKMALAHYLSGFIQVAFIYSVCFFSMWAFLALRTDCFALEYMIGYYALSLLLGLVIYSFIIFIFSQANSVVDGVIFCGLWAFLFYLCVWVARAYFIRTLIIDTRFWEETSNLSLWGILYTPINNLTVIFQNLIEINRVGEAAVYDYTARYARTYMEQMYMFFIWGAIGIAAAAGYFVTFVKKGAHMAGEISTSHFGYRLLIPLYGYMLLMIYGEIDLMTIVILAMMLVGYVIYRRGVKLKRSDIVFMICSVIPIMLSYLLRQ